MLARSFQPGDWVIYRKTKFSAVPGPRAVNVAPVPNGDGYVYNVDKYWVVLDVLEDNNLRLLTRRGKEQIVRQDDRSLRLTSWWERLRFRARYQPIEQAIDHRRRVHPAS